MNEWFVPFELAVKLKEKGFRHECIATYDIEDKGFDFNNYILRVAYQMNVTAKDCLRVFNDSNIGLIDAPTISQVSRWLREEYLIHISTKPYPCEDEIMWFYEIRKFNEYRSVVVANETEFIKEEQAVVAGIEYVLDNLI